jgi:hypothetical protein
MNVSPIDCARRPGSFLGALVLAAVGCQEVFGDFEVEPTPVPSSPPGTGGGSGGGASSSGGQVSTRCSAGEGVCEDDLLRYCLDGVWMEELCSSAERCDEVNVQCRTCAEGERRCLDEKTPQSCDVENDRWVTEPACDEGKTCDRVRGVCVKCEIDFGVCGSTTVLCRCKSDQSGYAPFTCPDSCEMLEAQDRCSGGEGSAGGPAGVCDNI